MNDLTFALFVGLASFDVKMKEGEQAEAATGFGSKHEAGARIVQVKRTTWNAASRMPPVPCKPTGATPSVRRQAG